nr:putative casein kinase II subunit beta-4 [Ipomoea batatas]
MEGAEDFRPGRRSWVGRKPINDALDKHLEKSSPSTSRTFKEKAVVLSTSAAVAKSNQETIASKNKCSDGDMFTKEQNELVESAAVSRDVVWSDSHEIYFDKQGNGCNASRPLSPSTPSTAANGQAGQDFVRQLHGRLRIDVKGKMLTNSDNSEEGKKKTELAKKNKRGGVLNGVAQSTHTTGSTPHVNVAAQLEQVATQREMLTGTGEQVDDNQLYYDVVGGHDKKRRIYGLGSYGCSSVNGSTSDNTSGNMTPTSRPPDNATSASVQDEIQSLKATILLMQQRLDAIDG